MRLPHHYMPKFLINGGKRLTGEITVAGFKNAVLPILSATLLTKRECVISNVPRILDVDNFLKILLGLGARVARRGNSVKISCAGVKKFTPEKKLVSSMRASVLLLGALLGRTGKAKLVYPGGDIIGTRPIDVHLRGFAALGASASVGADISVAAKKLQGAELFGESSVTGTENLILAAVLASGRSRIKLAAQEPHIGLLCRFLNKMGARISGIDTHTITIDGVARLHGARIRVIPDMIEAGTFAILGAATKSHFVIKGVEHGHLDAVYNKLWEMGVNFEKQGNNLIINRPTGDYRGATVRTGLYPNLATDLQPPFGVLATQARGKTIIHDWVFEGRLGYLPELKKMGANVKLIDSHRAEIIGPTKLRGGTIRGLDIRSGMTFLIAALVAKGKSVIDEIHHIDRGYERIDERLRALGAGIERVN